MRFTKMHGIGNDFIVVDAIHEPVSEPAALARRVCARRFGVGADGLILMCASERADATMRIFNSDGSEPEMCGNGIRCAAKFLYDTGLVKKADMAIDTLAGVKNIHLDVEGEQAVSVTVDMGQPVFEPARIPVAAESNRIRVSLGGREVSFFCVSMGNPHFVIFVPDITQINLSSVGPLIENHPYFPDRTNVEFVQVLSDGEVRMRVWERGSGITQACGTGACATAVAAVVNGKCDRTVRVNMDGGTLTIEWRATNGHVYMTGGAVNVFEGFIKA